MRNYHHNRIRGVRENPRTQHRHQQAMEGCAEISQLEDNHASVLLHTSLTVAMKVTVCSSYRHGDGISKWVLLLCLLCAISGSLQQCLTADDTRMSTSMRSRDALYRGQQDFSLSLLAEINKRSPPGENIFFSPYSTYHALIMAYFLSSNQTEKALHQALHLGANQDKVDVLQAYKFDKLRGAPYEFSGANRIYCSSDLHVRDCMEETFNDELIKLNFRQDPVSALATINNWVEQQTKGMITNLIPQDAVDQQTSLVLVNAAYFKGQWQYRFPTENTHKTVFYITPSENTFVDMMTQEGTFNHDVSEALGAHVLQLPYEGDSASMYILLPPFASTDGLEKLLSRLNSKTLADIVSDGALVARTVEVSLPKFSVERTIELGSVLEGVGVGDLLRPTSDLSALTGNPRDRVTLGGAIHKARIEVDEEGTKAAAATSLFTFRSGRPVDAAQFVCNHPFVYFIYDRQKHAILFAGLFRRPQTVPISKTSSGST